MKPNPHPLEGTDFEDTPTAPPAAPEGGYFDEDDEPAEEEIEPAKTKPALTQSRENYEFSNR